MLDINISLSCITDNTSLSIPTAAFPESNISEKKKPACVPAFGTFLHVILFTSANPLHLSDLNDNFNRPAFKGGHLWSFS